MTQTLSETLFEKFCLDSGIQLTPVPIGDTKPPDYEMILDDQRIIVEVKETRPNHRWKSGQPFPEGVRWTEGGGTPGERVRKMIWDASPQIKAGTQKIYPSILVICESAIDGEGEYGIRVA